MSSMPSKRTEPSRIDVASGSRPMIERERMVLPEPDSPTMPSERPRASVKLTPSTARTTPSAVSNDVRRFVDLEQGTGAVAPGRLEAVAHAGAHRFPLSAARALRSLRSLDSLPAHPMASRTLKRSASTSPMRLMERMVRNRTSAGISEIHQASWSRSLPAKIIFPQVGVGASTESPR